MKKVVNGIEVDFEIEEKNQVVEGITVSYTVGKVDYYNSFKIDSLELTENGKDLVVKNETESFFTDGHEVDWLDITIGVISEIMEVKQKITDDVLLDAIESYGYEKGYGSDFYFLGVSKDERNCMYEHSY